MATTLTVAGMCWATLSLAASFLCSFGFYLPFWIQGRLLDKADAYFSSFRRCNYPRLMSDGTVALVHECGRYAKFSDIPSVWWQISTVLIGGATAITVIVAVSAVSACCVTHVIQKSTAKIAGYLQLLAVFQILRKKQTQKGFRFAYKFRQVARPVYGLTGWFVFTTTKVFRRLCQMFSACVFVCASDVR
ncbi:LHFPL tetraspan subfamily member 6 protein-like isoform X2 [Sipha flava]|uniref:LHFPL tetraspan subfamily member 6 protein-like isoform X2 n=1 Tax=Sipha flava TaxID=143950 RepID=A0A8B8FSQ1_9HEMI|nr:LHFPL tetraspan subfamily member 6 protein-like isoform X2 [Sipha flava]